MAAIKDDFAEKAGVSQAMILASSARWYPVGEDTPSQFFASWTYVPKKKPQSGASTSRRFSPSSSLDGTREERSEDLHYAIRVGLEANPGVFARSFVSLTRTLVFDSGERHYCSWKNSFKTIQDLASGDLIFVDNTLCRGILA